MSLPETRSPQDARSLVPMVEKANDSRAETSVSALDRRKLNSPVASRSSPFPLLCMGLVGPRSPAKVPFLHLIEIWTLDDEYVLSQKFPEYAVLGR